MAEGWYNEDWWRKIQPPTVSESPLSKWLTLNQKHEGEATTAGREYAYMQAHKASVDQKAQMAEFEAAQQGAPQSFVKHGKPFAMSRYKDTSMFPAKSMPVSDPGRLQAAPVGYEKEPWWRQSPYVAPRQPGYSIFNMKPYSWG